MGDLSLKGLAETVLPHRTAEYIGGFCEKLMGEGLIEPSDLLKISKEAIENKLSTHAAFNIMEMADTMSLRGALEKGGRDAGPKGTSTRRSRSRGRKSRNKRGRRGSPDNHRGHRRPSAPPQEKPALWAAVESNDQEAVRRLLLEGTSPEETYCGWTPLMKAAEENSVEIIKLLIEANADLEAKNRKQRTALSFAAAPSMKRPTAVQAMRVLLISGASTASKDSEGLTAKERAAKEKRTEAVELIEEFKATNVS